MDRYSSLFRFAKEAKKNRRNDLSIGGLLTLIQSQLFVAAKDKLPIVCTEGKADKGEQNIC
jgi:hypothetical protein